VRARSDPQRARSLKQGAATAWDVSEQLDELGQNHIQNLRLAVLQKLQSEQFPIPPLPAVVTQLNAIANSADPDLREACRIVERDSQLTGRVLNAASSVAFGARTATDLGQAVVRLGVRGLRDITFALMMGRVFRAQGALGQKMKIAHQRSFALAVTSAWICRALTMDMQYGFLAGLLADVGEQVLIAMFAEMEKNGGLPVAEPLDAIAELHADVGALVIGRWNLPDVLQQAARHHHRPKEAGAAMPLAMAVAARSAR
jgi:HD-like signal output (HDOD) protein